MKKEIVGFGLIGCGRAGMIHGRNFAGGVGGARIVAVMDTNVELRTQAAKELHALRSYAEVSKILADPEVDAVVIATPTEFHRDIAVAAAKAGKHILCEKPMARNEKECDEMISAADRYKVKLQIGFMRRFASGFIEAKRRIDSGEIGNVVQVKSLTHGPNIPKPWMCDIKQSNGPLAEVNSHDIDTLRWFTGSELVEVYAIGENYRCPDVRKKFPDFYDNVMLVGRFANGMQGFIGGAQGVMYGYDSRCEVLGLKGILFVGSLASESVMSCNASGMNQPVMKSWQKLYEDAYAAEDEDFAECIVNNRRPCVTGYDGRMAVAVVNAGNESIRTGKPVKLRVPKGRKK